MKMQEMNEYLEREGFVVTRQYDTVTKEYMFDIVKHGFGRRSYFKYTGPHSQKDFLDRMIREWEAAYKLHQSNENFTRTLINSVYGSSSYTKHKFIPAIKDVIYNGPATIVKWSDGTKTVVKCCEDDLFDPEKGLAMAISKKALGDLKEVKKWSKNYESPKFIYDFECTATATAVVSDNFKESVKRIIREVFEK